MWLNAGRLRNLGISSAMVLNTFAEIFPEGMNVTATRCMRLERRVTENDAVINWDDIAVNVLTQEGYAKFSADSSQWRRDHAMAHAIQLDRAKARYHTALARWRTEFNVHPNVGASVSRDAQVALAKIDRQYHLDERYAARERRKFKARLFGELSVDNGRPAYAEPSSAAQLAPNQVLVTAQTLRSLGSCDTYVLRFRRLWPDGTVITPELCLAHAREFDWHWAAYNLLQAPANRMWESTSTERTRELNVELNRHYAEYDDAVGKLRREHNAGRVTREQFRDKNGQLTQRHNDVVTRIQGQVAEVGARAFGELYVQHPREGLEQFATRRSNDIW
jgi:hypothetical protein